MTPTKTWKANRWRFDLRKYTRDFQKKFESGKKKTPMEVGNLYALSYLVDSAYPTDKHHFTPLALSFGRFTDDELGKHTRAVNLFYLSNSQVLEILEDFHKHLSLPPDARALQIIKLHEKYLKVFPYAFKNFEERRVRSQEEISALEWGMIPLLKKHLLGNFNPSALNEDFQLENKTIEKVRKERKKKINKIAPSEPVEEAVLEEFDNFKLFDEDEEEA